MLSESNRRLYEKLYRDLGSDIAAFLADPDVNEIMLNPDGKLWVDRTSNGQGYIGNMTRAQALSVLNSVAGVHNFVVSQHSPRLEG